MQHALRDQGGMIAVMLADAVDSRCNRRCQLDDPTASFR